jgi:acyl-CoA thioester hydrolase
MDDAKHFNISAYKHWVDDAVRFGDLDPVGHVNNNSVGQYFENARAHFYMKVTPNWPYRDTLFVLARTAIDFRRELHMPAALRVATGVMKIGRTSLTLANALFHNETGIAYGESISVLIDQRARKPVEIPEDLRAILYGYLVA